MSVHLPGRYSFGIPGCPLVRSTTRQENLLWPSSCCSVVCCFWKIPFFLLPIAVRRLQVRSVDSLVRCSQRIPLHKRHRRWGRSNNRREPTRRYSGSVDGGRCGNRRDLSSRGQACGG